LLSECFLQLRHLFELLSRGVSKVVLVLSELVGSRRLRLTTPSFSPAYLFRAVRSNVTFFATVRACNNAVLLAFPQLLTCELYARCLNEIDMSILFIAYSRLWFGAIFGPEPRPPSDLIRSDNGVTPFIWPLNFPLSQHIYIARWYGDYPQTRAHIIPYYLTYKTSFV
jgi:hypothetical protein